jgi:hypothetical protein
MNLFLHAIYRILVEVYIRNKTGTYKGLKLSR